MKMTTTVTKSSRNATVVTRNAGELDEDNGVMASGQTTSAGRWQGARVPGMFLVLCWDYFFFCFGCDFAIRDLAIRVSGWSEGLTVKGCGRGMMNGMRDMGNHADDRRSFALIPIDAGLRVRACLDAEARVKDT